ncbi:MAG: PEGA domain-containing protein [Deltaproteobacteria bacterium]|nr:PEGA domain-containing protein [Deltaproteobacteria bacterium]
MPPVPRQRAVSPDIQLRPQGLIAPVAMEEHRNPVARYRTRTQRRATPWRTWIWNSGSIAALFILVLIGRFLIADPSVTPTAGTVPEGHGEVTTANAGLQVETVRLNAQSPATTATTALLTIPASTSTNGKARQSATRYESMPQKLDTAQRSRRASRQLYGATKTGTLRINSRPWSQVFVDGRSVGTTPQMGLRLQAGRHTVKLVNRSFRLSKTITVELKPGQTVSEIVNLIE